MINKLTLLLILSLSSIALGQVSITAYEADGQTLYDSNDGVMIGQKLQLVVSSDSNDYWSGGIFVYEDDRALGSLAGRDSDPNTRDYENSHYEDAGDFALATGWKDSSIWGFDLYTFYPVDANSENESTDTGNWFVIDYEAEKVGDCNVGFYDYSVSWSAPNEDLVFTNIPTRDLDSNDVIQLADYALFSSQWGYSDCNDPNWCGGSDLDLDGDVDFNDLKLFVDYWLWGVSVEPVDVNESEMMGGGESMFSMDSTPAPSEEMTYEERIAFLEDIWQEVESLREVITQQEWDEFIDSVKNSSP